MATSITQIANLALIEVGAEPITLLTEDRPEAKAVNTFWDATLEAVLRAYPWSCAKARRTIAASGSYVPDHGFTYGLLLPADCIRLLSLSNDEPYELVGRVIECDSDSLEITYIKKLTDPTKFDALLVTALAARLAWAICYKLTQSNSLKESLWDSYRKVLQEARTVNAQETALTTIDADEWVDSRQQAPYVNRSNT